MMIFNNKILKMTMIKTLLTPFLVALALIMASTLSHANASSAKTIGAVKTVASVNEQVVSHVLNWIKSVKNLSIPLLQINADGSQLRGRMDIFHDGTMTDTTTGKMRLTYDDSPQYLVADGYWLWVVDTELGSQTAIDLKDTPAWFIVQPKSEIKRHGTTIMVTQASQIDSLYRVKFQSQSNPDDGFLILWYDPAENRPARWEVSDQQGGITTVLFEKPIQNPTFPKNHFQKPNFDG